MISAWLYEQSMIFTQQYELHLTPAFERNIRFRAYISLFKCSELGGDVKAEYMI